MIGLGLALKMSFFLISVSDPMKWDRIRILQLHIFEKISQKKMLSLKMKN